jgi:putative ABC transport system permease protein
MIHLTFQNLWQGKFRLALSIGGVALSIMLIILLNGFLSGIYIQVTAYLDNTPGDLVIAQDGVTNMLSATSVLPARTDDVARGIAGIERVTPIISQFVILDLHDEKVVAYLVGYDPDFGGGPWKMAVGRTPEGDDEIVLDWVMAQDHGFKIGDTIEILDEEFTVVGLSDDTNSWMASFIFVSKRAAERLLILPDASSFVLVTLNGGADQEAIIARLSRRLRDMEIVPIETMIQNDLDLLVEIFAIPLRMMVSIAFAVGTAILGMVIYTATVERQREYGVLKAVGARNHHLYGLVTLQGLAMALAGIVVGVGAAWLASDQIMETYPAFLIVIERQSILTTSFTGLIMGLLAALLPARQVAHLDPAKVFRK